MIEVRPAAQDDLAQACAIYAHHVLHSLATFEETPPGEDEFRARHAAVVERKLPWLVACDGARVLGFAYVTPFRPRSAYRFTVEDSVYVSPDAHRRGIGRALLEPLITTATACGARQMIAAIGDSGNAASIGLHAAMGFEPVGTYRSVGLKLGRWVDVVLMQRSLGPGDSTSP